MKVGDLVNNTHAALDGQGLGLIVNVTKRQTESGLDIKVQWINPPLESQGVHGKVRHGWS